MSKVLISDKKQTNRQIASQATNRANRKEIKKKKKKKTHPKSCSLPNLAKNNPQKSCYDVTETRKKDGYYGVTETKHKIVVTM